MPRIEGGMADVSTAYRIAPEGEYPVEITTVDDTKSKKTKVRMFVVNTALRTNDEETNGITISTFCVLEKSKEKGGGRNDPGVRQFKRIVEQTLGEDAANDPEFDTSELHEWRGNAMVKIEDYEDEEERDPAKRAKQRNYISRYFSNE